MAYTKQTWTDRKVEKPLTFLMTTNADGSITLAPYPGVIEQEGSQLSASRFNHIEDGIANSVNKAGDTMTGRLNITNKGEFAGVSKTRTVDGIDYVATLGVGADASASLELHDASKTLGRIDINKDGKIKNFKTGKYLAEIDLSFQDLSLASGITVGSIAKQAKYKKTGNIVSVIGDIAGVKKGNTVVATLPEGYRPPFSIYVLGTCSGQRFCRWIIRSDGAIVLEWVSNLTYDSVWYGLNFSFPVA